MRYLNYPKLLPPGQEGSIMGPGRGGKYFVVAEQINDHNTKTTQLGLVELEDSTLGLMQ